MGSWVSGLSTHHVWLNAKFCLLNFPKSSQLCVNSSFCSGVKPKLLVQSRLHGEGLGGFRAEPGQGSTGFRGRFRRRSGRLRCKARSGSTGFRRRSGRLWCSQVRFNRVQGSGVTEKVLEKDPGRAAIQLTQLRCFQRLASQHASERFVTIKRCSGWGYHRSLFFQNLASFGPQVFSTALGEHGWPQLRTTEVHVPGAWKLTEMWHRWPNMQRGPSVCENVGGPVGHSWRASGDKNGPSVRCTHRLAGHFCWGKVVTFWNGSILFGWIILEWSHASIVCLRMKLEDVNQIFHANHLWGQPWNP